MPQITPEFLKRFEKLRQDLFDAIKHSLDIDGHCKSYEGRLELHYPNYFDDDNFAIVMACYLIGPGRGHVWVGTSFDDALDSAEKDIREWIAEEYLSMDDDYWEEDYA